MIETTTLATDVGAIVKLAARTLTCIFLGSLHVIPKGAEYVGFASWSHRPSDRMCLDCARHIDLIGPEEEARP